MKKLIIYLILILFLNSCIIEYKEKFLYLTNNSNHSINLYFNNLKKMNNDAINKVYPDTLIRKDIEIWIGDEILAGKRTVGVIGANDWKELYSLDAPQDTLSLFIFHKDTIAKYSWDEIRGDYKILTRYDLSLEDLKRLDFVLTYPPDERMNNIKIFKKSQ